MEWVQQLLGILSVHRPTRLVSYFHLCNLQRSNSVPTSAMVRTTQHSGHNPGLKCSVIWAPFPESPTIPMTIFQSCGGTQPLMTSNFSALQPFHPLIIAKCF